MAARAAFARSHTQESGPVVTLPISIASRNFSAAFSLSPIPSPATPPSLRSSLAILACHLVPYPSSSNPMSSSPKRNEASKSDSNIAMLLAICVALIRIGVIGHGSKGSRMPRVKCESGSMFIPRSKPAAFVALVRSSATSSACSASAMRRAASFTVTNARLSFSSAICAQVNSWHEMNRAIWTSCSAWVMDSDSGGRIPDFE
mmetsp:Transcript_3893/g.17772  ORF Transcript_3893/g.17772 Transcript_3893/m.17772 type:complete len:203 (+) Transcript_3893:248-856(+)